MSSLTLVSGKGGVGKTRCSLLYAATRPGSVLTDFSLGQALREEASHLQLKQTPLIRPISKADLAEAFLDRSLKFHTLAHWIGKTKLFQILLSLAPNLNELLLLHQWVNLAKDIDLIVDAPATGHFISLFEALQTARELFDGGSLRTMADEVHAYLQRESKVTVIRVSLAEVSSLEESAQIEDFLRTHYPKIQQRHFLNRKHQQPEDIQTLSDPLKALAIERPRREDLRIEGLTLDHILVEGATSL